MPSTKYRKITNVTILCLWFIWSSAVTFSTQSHSQEAGLGTILKQLKTLESKGALGDESGSQGSILDYSQEDSSGIGSGNSGPSAREKEVTRKIEAAKQMLITEFCRNGIISKTSSEAELSLLLSPIEQDFCQRAAEPLEQFGYNIFAEDDIRKGAFTGAIQDDYILGIGDEVVVTFHGQTRGDSRVRIDREGRAFIKDLPPIPAAGLTFADFRRELEARVKTAMFGTDVFLSLGKVRSISVTVAGAVKQPGLKALTSQSTVLDALALAGGIKKTGTLRKIQVFRDDAIYWVDIYELLLGIGLTHRLSLLDGDRIVVPTIGSVVAVSGKVKRPGIFELREGSVSAPFSYLLDLAGGTLRPNGNVFSHGKFDQLGRERIVDHSTTEMLITDGEIVQVRQNHNIQINSVELLGHVRVSGRRSLSSAPTLRALMQDAEGLKDDPYLLFGVLETTDPAARARRLFPVNLQAIIDGKQDYALRQGDRFIVLGKDDIKFLMSNDVQQVLQFGRAVQDAERLGISSDKSKGPKAGNPVQQVLIETGVIAPSTTEDEKETEKDGKKSKSTEFSCSGLQSLATITSTTRSGRFVQAIRATGLEGVTTLVNPLPCPAIYDVFPGLLPFVLEHVVAVDGEVRSPGAYPMLDGTSLSSVVSAAGGLTRNADLRNLELTRFAKAAGDQEQPSERQIIDVNNEGFESVAINAGDVIRFNRKFTDRDAGPVLLGGEFLRPGLFDIRRGERLSEVIARAGGLTAQAYPYGAVFTRERVKRAQQAGFERARRELRSAAAFAAAKKGVSAAAVAALEQISQDLTSAEAVGRVVIEADPTALSVRPEFDTVLEPGDKLFMPKRPNSVLVIGDVLNPGALQFISGQQADKYIRQAGGFQQSADQNRVFVVFPNGVAQPISISVWNYNPSQVPPGSTIVAPKNPAPLDIFTFAKDIGSLVGQLAITAASLAVIGDN